MPWNLKKRKGKTMNEKETGKNKAGECCEDSGKRTIKTCMEMFEKMSHGAEGMEKMMEQCFSRRCKEKMSSIRGMCCQENVEGRDCEAIMKNMMTNMCGPCKKDTQSSVKGNCSGNCC